MNNHDEVVARCDDLEQMSIQEAQFFVESLRYITDLTSSDKVKQSFNSILDNFLDSLKSAEKRLGPESKMSEIKGETNFNEVASEIEKFFSAYP